MTTTTNLKLTTKDLLNRLRANDDEAAEKLGGMQLMDTDILVAAATGKLDLNQVAALLVAFRGIGRNGRWVGFQDAEWQMDELIKKLASSRTQNGAGE